VDEEFTDAEIRAILKMVASERRRDEMRRRLERAGDAQDNGQGSTPSEIPDRTPLRKPAA
jgi:hypothetical protein